MRTKLNAGFAVVAVALLLAVAVGWISMLSVSTTVRNGFNKAVLAEGSSKWAYNMRVSQAQSAAIGHGIKNPDGSDMHTGDVAVFAKEFAQVKAVSTSTREKAALAHISAAYAKWAALDERVIGLWKSGDKQARA